MKVEKMRKFVRFLGPFINGYGVSLYQYGLKDYRVFIERVPSMRLERFVRSFPSKEAAEEWFNRQGEDSADCVYRIIQSTNEEEV